MIPQMFGVIASLLLAPQSGILVVDQLAVAIAQNGQWKQMDSIYSKNWPKMNVPEGTVKAASSGTVFLLSGKEAKSIPNPGLKYGGEDADPGSRGWTLGKEINDYKNVLWFGSKPTAPTYKVLSNSSDIYKKAVLEFVKKKGLKKPAILLQSVIQADLDGNGSQEVMIYCASRSLEDIHNSFSGNIPGPKTEHFSAVLIRSVSGKSVKTTEVYYTDAKTGGIDGHMAFAGLWELDGKPGLEIVSRWSGYEANSASLAKFSGGKFVKIAEAGDGV